MLLKWLLKKKAVNDNRFFMRTAQTDEKYYHCLSCDYAWPGSCPSPCGKCHSTNVTQCSEIVYINCVKRCLQDKKGKTMKKKNLIISISAGIAACIAALLLLSLILSWIYPSKTYGEIICDPTVIFVSLLIGLVAGLESWKGDVDINSKRK